MLVGIFHIGSIRPNIITFDRWNCIKRSHTLSHTPHIMPHSSAVTVKLMGFTIYYFPVLLYFAGICFSNGTRTIKWTSVGRSIESRFNSLPPSRSFSLFLSLRWITFSLFLYMVMESCVCFFIQMMYWNKADKIDTPWRNIHMKIERMTHTHEREKQNKRNRETRENVYCVINECVFIWCMHSSHARIEKPSNVVVNKHFQSREITMAYILK